MKRFVILTLMFLLATSSIPAAAEDGAAVASAAETVMVQDKAMDDIDKQIAAAGVDKSVPDWRTKLSAPTVAEFDESHEYFVRMETTKGTVLIRLLPDVAPMHVTSFVFLTKLGYYDGLNFHRVITSFMAQGGCPLGNGTGGPGYQFAGEYSKKVKHDKPGLLSMANAGPGTDGSQFFLTFVATPWLDGKHTIFGEVVEGMDTLKQLESLGSKNGRTSELLSMGTVTVEVRAKS